MVVATTRTRDQSPAFLFGGGRAPEASFADMVVSIPPDAKRQIGEVQLAQQPPGDPAWDFVTLKSEIVTRDQAAASLSRLIGRSREKEAFVFVHGFNNRYEDAVYRFAQILHDSGADSDVAPILFTWPLAGNVFAYNYDRDSANYSRDDLEKLLKNHLDPGPFDGQLGDARSVAANGDPRRTRRPEGQARHARGRRRRRRYRARADRDAGTGAPAYRAVRERKRSRARGVEGYLGGAALGRHRSRCRALQEHDRAGPAVGHQHDPLSRLRIDDRDRGRDREPGGVPDRTCRAGA